MTFRYSQARFAEFVPQFLRFLHDTSYTPSTWPRGSPMPQSAAADVPSRTPAANHPYPHPLDQLSLGKIVQIRERLLAAQAVGRRVYRFESGDPSFAARSRGR